MANAKKYEKSMALANIRDSPHDSTLAAVIDNHPYEALFFKAKLVDNYYQPMARDHASIHEARVHAIVAAASHMDYGLGAIHLGKSV